jgi:hypothetical protein
VGKRSFGLPFDLVAGGFCDEERLAAALIAVAVHTLLDGEVEDLAFGDFRSYSIG